jgi:hypothetical protein
MLKHIALSAFLALSLRADVRVEERTVHLGPIAPGQSPYVYVPFDVPANSQEIVLRLDYDHAGGDNVVDYLVFDSSFSGRDDDMTGFRGRNPNRLPLISVIGRDSASTGNLPGPLLPGVWRVMFYVYKAPVGVDVHLSISISSEAAGVAESGPRESGPSESGPRWMHGDLHMHTLHSDGTWTVTMLAAAAQRAGLDFIAITDHNTSAHHAEIDRFPKGEPLLIRGTEITTYDGHMNAWGIPSGRVFEHRQLPGQDDQIQKLIAAVHATGGLISVNHPYATCKACEWGFSKQVENFDGMEVWNNSWSVEDESSLKLWDSILRQGHHIALIGSSDSHGPDVPIGEPTISVYADEVSVAGVLNAIHRGRTVVTSTPAGKIRLEAGPFKPGDTITTTVGSSVNIQLSLDGFGAAGEAILISQSGEVKRWKFGAGPWKQEVVVPAQTGYLRLEARDENSSMLGLTNPIWIETR